MYDRVIELLAVEHEIEGRHLPSLDRQDLINMEIMQVTDNVASGIYCMLPLQCYRSAERPVKVVFWFVSIRKKGSE